MVNDFDTYKKQRKDNRDNVDNISRDFDEYKYDLDNDSDSNKNKLLIGEINRNKLFSNPFHKVNQDYLGDAHINLSNFRFHLLIVPFYNFYMLYYRTYGLFIIISLILGILGFILNRYAGLIGSLIMLMIMAVMSISITELIRYARVKKYIKLKNKGYLDSKIQTKLKPSWIPIIIYIVLLIVLYLVSLYLVTILFIMFLKAVFT